MSARLSCKQVYVISMKIVITESAAIDATCFLFYRLAMFLNPYDIH